MATLLVEIKNEYTTQLLNILSPLIFQGIQSIYNEAKTIVKNNCDTTSILKIFQSCLKSVLNWNQITIDNETSRIVTSPYIINKINDTNYNYEWLNDLVKATLKANIMILMYNPVIELNNIKINPLFYRDIKLSNFIHRIYIECAMELWNNPYLLYHNYPPIEIKRNHRDCMIIIKECIKEAIRKLLPIKHILHVYLEDIIDVENIYKSLDNPSKKISELNYNTKKSNDSVILDIINKDESTPNDILKDTSKDTPNLTKSIHNLNKVHQQLSESENLKIENPLFDKNQFETHKSKCKSKHMYKFNRNNINKLTEISENNPKLENNQSTLLSINNDEILSNINKSIQNNESISSNTLDTKIKNILNNDLAIDASDLETSIVYSPDTKYQAIFSN